MTKRLGRAERAQQHQPRPDQPHQEREPREHARGHQHLGDERQSLHHAPHVAEEAVQAEQHRAGEERHRPLGGELGPQPVGRAEPVADDERRRRAGEEGGVEGAPDRLGVRQAMTVGEAVNLPYRLHGHQQRAVPGGAGQGHDAHDGVGEAAMRVLLGLDLAVGGLEGGAQAHGGARARDGLMASREGSPLREAAQMLDEGRGGADHRRALVAVAEGDGRGEHYALGRGDGFDRSARRAGPCRRAGGRRQPASP